MDSRIQPGIDDLSVLARAQDHDTRILLTCDKDFGELAFRVGLPAAGGIILFRLFDSDPAAEAHRLLSLIKGGVEWTGRFSVIRSAKLRQSPLPSPDQNK